MGRSATVYRTVFGGRPIDVLPFSQHEAYGLVETDRRPGWVTADGHQLFWPVARANTWGLHRRGRRRPRPHGRGPRQVYHAYAVAQGLGASPWTTVTGDDAGFTALAVFAQDRVIRAPRAVAVATLANVPIRTRRRADLPPLRVKPFCGGTVEFTVNGGPTMPPPGGVTLE